GAPVDAVRAGLPTFRGAPHRYEDLGVMDGIRYINDTAATAPAAAVAALADAMLTAKAIVLFAGRVPTPLAAMLAERGYTGPIIGPVRSMDEAMDAAGELADPGDTVLLSPGAASFGVFENEFDRGDQFRAAVARLRAGRGD
ncbi:MAG TPA: hypothetical protein VIC60_07850, partial [Thermomicrobiales bacterium]